MQGFLSVIEKLIQKAFLTKYLIKMKSKVGLGFFCMFLIAIILSNSANALTGATGSARMVIKGEVGKEIEKYILVKNVNDVPVTINLSASGDLTDSIKILDSVFELEPGQDKKAYFTIKAKDQGIYESKINILFKSEEEKNGVGISSTIIFMVYGKGEAPGDDDADIGDDGDNGADVTGGVVTNNKQSTTLIMFFLLLTPVLLIILLIVIYKRGKKGGNRLKSKKGALQK